MGGNMNFTDIMDTQLLRVDFAPSNKDDALHQIAKLGASSPTMQGIDADTLYGKLVEREAAVTTGLGNGVAIPHARITGLDNFVVFLLVAPRGIDFEALDKKKVQIFFVVFAPDDKVSEHLQLLASISRLLSQASVRKEICKATNPDVLYEIVARSVNSGTSLAEKNETMKLLCIILYYEDNLQAVLEFFIDQGIKGATVIESKGMGAYVSTIPLFAGMLRFMRDDRNASHTILTLIPARHEKIIVQGIEKITGDLDTKQGAMLVTLDLSMYKGTMSMI
jgi:PTS system nitrogen regulatory IIA component